MPTTSPASLIAVAAEVVSLPYGGSTRFTAVPGPHSTARNCSTCGSTQSPSLTAVSAQPTATPALLMPVAKPLLPPSSASLLSAPFCHRNGRHVCPLVGMNAEQENVSPLGSGVAVSEMPTASPWLFLMGHSIALFMPPRVPRSSTLPGIESVACRAPLALSDAPVTQPRLLMPAPKANSPPRVPVS